MWKKSTWTKDLDKKLTAKNRGHCKAEINRSPMIPATKKEDL